VPYHPRPERETDVEHAIRELAQRYAWPLAYHTHDSRRSAAGFPDWIFARPGRLVALELKTERGRVRPEQAAWIGVLDSVPGCSAAIIHGLPDLQHAANLLAR
jgi:hypothetical protein